MTMDAITDLPGIPLVRPSFQRPELVLSRIARSLDVGSLTAGEAVAELERSAETYLGVRHCIAVASCTTGLMLVLKAADLRGEIVMPSFTFVATANAAEWNGLTPAFADILPGTLTLDPARAADSIHTRTCAIVATHLYGTPAEAEALETLAARTGIRVFFDAAHAFGAERAGRRVGGFGDAEVFSLSPTKPLVAAEGGIIATNDDLLAERCRIGRDYGHPGDYDARFSGLNGRMSELHAAVALASFADLEERLAERAQLAGLYREALGPIPGIRFPEVPKGDRSTYKDLTILIDPDRFGVGADEVAARLAAAGIETRRYYAPPVHRMRAYRAHAGRALPMTDTASRQALSLPLWTGMGPRRIERVAAEVIEAGRGKGTPMRVVHVP